MGNIKKISIYGIVILLFLFIIFILGYINIYKHSFYARKLDDKQNKYISLASAPRGRILDRNGNILVDNIGVKTIVYKKSNSVKKTDEIEIAKKLADLITLDYNESIRELKDYYILLNKEETDNLITDKEYDLYNNRKLSNDDLYKYKLERITEEMLSTFNDKDRLTAHIYSLMNKGYKYEIKIIK